MNVEKNGIVNVSVANIYRQGSYGSEVVTQAILGEAIRIGETAKDFSNVVLPDGYNGWISNYQWVPAATESQNKQRIRSHYIKIYAAPQTDAPVLRDATIGAELNIHSIKETWHEIVLPDGVHGWVPLSHFQPFPDFTRENVVELAREFLGIPYHWGGRSPKGFDCSGFVQTVFSLLGSRLPRDAWMQHRDGQNVGKFPEEARPGDLYFFSDSGSKITHVGIALGNSRIIHARGRVRYDSMDPDQAEFNRDLADTLVEIGTYF